MKALVLASAAVLALGFGSASAAATGTPRQTRHKAAMSEQASGLETGSPYGRSSNDPAHHPFIGGWEALPPNSAWGGD